MSLKKSKIINLRRFFLAYFILFPLFFFQQGFTNNLDKANFNQARPNVHYVFANDESSDNNGIWDIENATFSGNRIRTSISNARGTEFKSDGTKMYILGRSSQTIFEFELSIAWDITSVTLVQELDISTEMGSGEGYNDSNPHGLFFNKENGKDVYVFNRREVWQYELSTPWDISSASQIKYKDLSNVVTRGHDIHFKPDGTKFYVEDRINRKVNQYSLSSPWNVETLKLEFSLDISEQEEAVRGIEIKPDGTRMYLMDTDRKEVLQYELEMPWEIESAYFTTTFDVRAQTDNPRSITWRPDGSTFFVTHSNNGTIFQYHVASGDSDSENNESNEGDNDDNTDDSGDDDSEEKSSDIEEDILTAPIQTSPIDEEKKVSQVMTFKWYSIQGAEYYILHASGTNPSEMVIDLAVTDTTYTVEEPLNSDRVHHWRVRGVKDGVQGDWSDIWEFTTTTDTNSNEEGDEEVESGGMEEDDNGGENNDESSDSDFDSDEGDNGSSGDKNETDDGKDGENENEDEKNDNEEGGNDKDESESGRGKDNEGTEQHKNLKNEKNVVLDQNYPNPFNPSTVIRFYLPETQNITLIIYNMAGQEVATLMNGNLLAGNQTSTFFADGLSSGIYFYRLVTENQVITRKMTFIK